MQQNHTNQGWVLNYNNVPGGCLILLGVITLINPGYYKNVPYGTRINIPEPFFAGRNES